MRRFEFVTGTVPVTGGRGVEWEDGTSAYRQITSGVLGEIICGHYVDIAVTYGKQQGYEFTWLDGTTWVDE